MAWEKAWTPAWTRLSDGGGNLVEILIECWGAAGSGGTILNAGTSREGGDGGIRAARFAVPRGSVVDYVVGQGGQPGTMAADVVTSVGVGGTGKHNGGSSADGGNQVGGAGGGSTGASIAATDIIEAGGGGGGCSNNDSPGQDGAARSSGATDTPSGTGGSATGTGEDGLNNAAPSAGVSGGGGGGGRQGGSATGTTGGNGGTSYVQTGPYFSSGVDTTAESSMTPAAGGARGQNNATPGAGGNGRIRITIISTGSVILDETTPGSGSIAIAA
jgi:hypothetical protein